MTTPTPADLRRIVARMTISDILAQTTVWRTGDGMPILLTSMAPSHRSHTLAFLRRRAEGLYESHLWNNFGDAPDDVFNEMIDERQALGEKAEDWIERRPFIRALADLVHADCLEDLYASAVDGTLVCAVLEQDNAPSYYAPELES